MDAVNSPPAQTQYERVTGLGIGKDMATILKAEERRGSMEEDDKEQSAGEEYTENGENGKLTYKTFN